MNIYTLILISVFSFKIGYSQIPEHLLFEPVVTESNPNFQYITTLNNDSDGNVWFSSFRGLFKYNGYKFKLYVNDPNDIKSLVNNKVFNTFLATDGQLWISAIHGVQVYDPIKDNFDLKLQAYVQDQKDIYDVAFYDIAEIDKNHLLIATKRGVLVYDKVNDQVEKKDSLSPLSVRDNSAYTTHVLNIKEDNIDPDLLWLYTRMGLFKYSRKTLNASKVNGPYDSFFLANKERGFSMALVGNHIFLHSIHKDIYAFNKVTGKWKIIVSEGPYIRNLVEVNDQYCVIVHIGQATQIINGENLEIIKPQVSFTEPLEKNQFSSATIDPNGYLVAINGLKGLMKTSEKLVPTNRTYSIFRSDLQVNGSAYKDTFDRTQDISLKSYQRDISFKIGLNNPDQLKDLKYFYKVGQDTDWVDISKDRNVNLSKLKPGDIQIFGKVENGSISTEASVLQVRIKPYFYESFGFKLGIASLVGIIVFGYFWQGRRRRKDRASYDKKLLEMQMNSLRSQMNPHFLFNSLNSIKSYMVNRGPDEAAVYITRFSLLIRKILENSRKNLLTLEQEIETLELYVEMEQKRFNNKFEYKFEIDKEIDLYSFQVAPMLIQPYVENAIWHGLMNKEKDRKLEVTFDLDVKGVICTIRDNGIGRELSQELKHGSIITKSSLGMEITSDRLASINALYNIKSTVSIHDLEDGTEVVILLPKIH